MELGKVKTEELIELYIKIKEFETFLEKEGDSEDAKNS